MYINVYSLLLLFISTATDTHARCGYTAFLRAKTTQVAENVCVQVNNAARKREEKENI